MGTDLAESAKTMADWMKGAGVTPGQLIPEGMERIKEAGRPGSVGGANRPGAGGL